MRDGQEIIGSHEAAEILNISVRSAQRWLKEAAETGEITVIYQTARGERLVTRESVERYAHKDS